MKSVSSSHISPPPNKQMNKMNWWFLFFFLPSLIVPWHTGIIGRDREETIIITVKFVGLDRVKDIGVHVFCTISYWMVPNRERGERPLSSLLICENIHLLYSFTYLCMIERQLGPIKKRKERERAEKRSFCNLLLTPFFFDSTINQRNNTHFHRQFKNKNFQRRDGKMLA